MQQGLPRGVGVEEPEPGALAIDQAAGTVAAEAEVAAARLKAATELKPRVAR